MPRLCTVCRHEERPAIDRALIAGESFRTIAQRFHLSATALHRHKRDHVPASLAKAADVAEAATATGLLARLRTLNAETAAVLAQAKRAADHELALKAIARAERQIELEGRLLGELQDGATVNIIVSPEWLAVRSVLLTALAPFPAARVAVAERLAALEAGHAGA
jgi:hypothetical protein